MIQIDLSAKVRENYGKGAARTLRRAGRTPAVLYGPNVEALSLDLETRGFTKSLLGLQRANAVVNLTIEDSAGKSKKRHVLIKELQTDPILDSLVHADFLEITLDKPIALRVPLNYVGKAKGVDLGGEVVKNRRDVLVQGPILEIPDFIEVAVSDLEIGDSIACQDLAVPDNVKLLEANESLCFSVIVAGVREIDTDDEEAKGEAVTKDAAE